MSIIAVLSIIIHMESSAAINWITIKKQQQHSALIWAECCWFYHLKSAFKMAKSEKE